MCSIQSYLLTYSRLPKERTCHTSDLSAEGRFSFCIHKGSQESDLASGSTRVVVVWVLLWWTPSFKTYFV